MDKLIGVTGYSGMVGQELLQYDGIVPLACDVREKSQIEMAIRNTKVDLIVHLASVSDVDECEDPKNEQRVTSINVLGTLQVLEAAEKFHCDVVMLSSSQVFNGWFGNYKENARPKPANFYGMTKMAAEGFRESFPFMKVVRTSYLFDYRRMFPHVYPMRAGYGHGYPTFIERSFMYLPHFADSFYQYLQNYSSMPNVLHISGCETVSWYQFMNSLAKVYNLPESCVVPRKKELEGATPRPYKGGLNVGLSRKLGLPQYSYMDGLQEMRLRS